MRKNIEKMWISKAISVIREIFSVFIFTIKNTRILNLFYDTQKNVNEFVEIAWKIKIKC